MTGGIEEGGGGASGPAGGSIDEGGVFSKGVGSKGAWLLVGVSEGMRSEESGGDR